MSDPEIYPVSAELAARAHMDRAGYEAARIQARETPDAFWATQAERLDWMTFPTKIKDVSFNKADFRIRWFEDGVLNASVNCIDR
ncbi:acetyl-coenzyme A synthetase N-terminal domain-containing protein, partial [Brevundimonas naejangsanensis]